MEVGASHSSNERGKVFPDDEDIGIEVIVLMGLPGSGKSSFYRKHFEGTHVHVSKDLMGKKKNKSLKQEKLISDCLSNRKSIVVDNMNLKREEREKIISLARKFGARVELYYFPLSVQESFERNAGPNRTEVPPVAIYTAQKILEEPRENEDFDSVHVIHN
jgi:predicted kinase